MSDLRVISLGLDPDFVPYERGWAEQRRVHADVLARRTPDTILLLEHEPVFTAGRRTEDWERPRDSAAVLDVDRGGHITWHGPGQLTGYPIFRLTGEDGAASHVAQMQDVLRWVCAEVGVATTTVPGRPGVWVQSEVGRPSRKLAAIGVRVVCGVTLHGFALNCDCDLSSFSRIVACGLRDASATSLAAELGRTVSVRDVMPLVERRFRDARRPG